MIPSAILMGYYPESKHRDSALESIQFWNWNWNWNWN